MKQIVIFSMAIALFSIPSLEGCSRVFWNTNEKAKLVARTMDLFLNDEPDIWIHPRGVEYTGGDFSNPLEWTSKYGSISVSCFGDRNIVSDGLNEEGLAVHAQVLMSTVYEQRDDRPSLAYGLWMQYILGACKNVEEVVAAHKNFVIIPYVFKNILWPLHVIVDDKSGDSAIIEFDAGEMKIYHSKEYKVVTNDPTYDTMIKALQTVDRFKFYSRFYGKQDSMSRFINGNALLKNLKEPANVEEGMQALKDGITLMFQKGGKAEVESFEDLQVGELKTYWLAISDLTNGTYHFYPQDGTKSIHLDLQKIDFSEGKKVEKMETPLYATIL